MAVIIEHLITAWIATKTQRSKNKMAVRSYHLTLTMFRAYLQERGLELDSDPVIVACAAEKWAHQGDPAPATYRNRLSMISSFYQYGRASEWLTSENPINLIDRQPGLSAPAGRAPDAGTSIQHRTPLNRSILTDVRDHALLVVGLTAFRRAAELARLRWSHIALADDHLTLIFQDSQADIAEREVLAPDVAQTLIHYVHTLYGPRLTDLPANTPIWASTSRRNFGRAISAQAIADIYRKHLGVSRLSELQERGTLAVAQALALATALHDRFSRRMATIVKRPTA
jgi:site-specific recombinase XerD